MFLNPHLYQDLVQLNQKDPEVFCFDSIDEGIRNFVSKTGKKAEKLPTSEESKEIKEEQDSLPPLGWLGMDYTTLSLFQHDRQRRAAQFMTTSPDQFWQRWMKPDPDKT